MFSEDKVTEIYCLVDNFCKLFDAQMKKYMFLSKKTLVRCYSSQFT